MGDCAPAVAAPQFPGCEEPGAVGGEPVVKAPLAFEHRGWAFACSRTGVVDAGHVLGVAAAWAAAVLVVSPARDGLGELLFEFFDGGRERLLGPYRYSHAGRVAF